MLTMIQTNALAIGAVVVLGLLVAWLIWGRKKPVRERHRSADVLDEGAGPARRNQALIDAPSAAARVAAPLGGSGVNLGGFGDVAAMAAAAEVAASHEADVVEVVAAPVTGPVAGPATGPVAGDPVAETPGAESDDLTRLKGVGPKLSARLRELGVVSFAQIAGWSAQDLAGIDAQLGTFAGRPTRDGWVEQAGFLAAGDVAGYEAKFGKL